MNLIEQLKKEKESLLKRIDAIDLLLESYSENINENNTEDTTTTNKFPKDKKKLDQIIFIIKNENRFLHTNEIVEIMSPYHIDMDKETLKRRVSSILSISKSKGEIPNLISVNYSPSRKDTVWGSKDWLDDNGKIKPEFMFKTKGAEKHRLFL